MIPVLAIFIWDTHEIRYSILSFHESTNVLCVILYNVSRFALWHIHKPSSRAVDRFTTLTIMDSVELLWLLFDSTSASWTWHHTFITTPPGVSFVLRQSFDVYILLGLNSCYQQQSKACVQFSWDWLNVWEERTQRLNGLYALWRSADFMNWLEYMSSRFVICVRQSSNQLYIRHAPTPHSNDKSIHIGVMNKFDFNLNDMWAGMRF